MNDAYRDAFFTLHRDLPREGPGEPADVAWAADLAGVGRKARICDAACGPGADIPALLAAAPEGHVTALDKTESFVDQAKAAHGADPRTTIMAGDMADIAGPYDFIWCAGAVYFLGVREALETWKTALAPGGAIAFSQVCWFTETPSRAALEGWAEYPDMTGEAGLLDHIRAAGYDCAGTRRLSDAAWEAYYQPMDARINALAVDAKGALADVLQEGRDEAALWRDHRNEFGYLLCVVRPG
ncbi:trans-aconitate 2-methyltransferase [uncultured Roseobacter sp.]|uniref:class I SAM-dependent methyltransferase n=1 Tax=uncultured Roseobacter sp. TaxID=114847 RepID=UPI00261453CC|nr:class I SAM-dependent methyltransferase [uncultured Roseobacter sp.]